MNDNTNPGTWRVSREITNSSIISDNEDELEATAEINDDTNDGYIVANNTKQVPSTSRNSFELCRKTEGTDSSNDGRLTPMIEKAIRRSILSFSNATSDEDDDGTVKNKGEPSEFIDDNVFEGSPFIKERKKQNTSINYSSDEEPMSVQDNSTTLLTPKEVFKQPKEKEKGFRADKSNRNRIMLIDDSSDEDNCSRDDLKLSNVADESFEQRKLIIKPNDDSKINESIKHSSPKKEVPAADDSFDDEFASSSNHYTTKIKSFKNENVSSDDTLSDDSLGDAINYDNDRKINEMAIWNITDEEDSTTDSLSETNVILSLAKEELKNNTIDPLGAQKRAYLLHKMQQLENLMSNTKTRLISGQLKVSDDNGKQLKQNIALHEKELEDLTEELKRSQLDQIPEDKKPPRKPIDMKPAPPLFKQENIDIDLALSKNLINNHKALGKKAQDTLQREHALTVERLQDLHGSLLARPTENQKAKDPRGLLVPLMSHQQHALLWLLWREQQKPRGGVLADDMGLGKTLTMISLVMASKARNASGEGSDSELEYSSSSRPQRYLGGTLVVAPASLLAQWESEVKNRCKRGMLSVELYHGNNRESVPSRLAKNDIVVTTYNILSRQNKMTGILFKIYWRRVILDEAHIVRNHKSQMCEAVCALNAKRRWAVTGTPIHNKEMDLYAILKFLQCSPFDDVRVWKRWVDNRNSAGHQRLATVMKTLMLRRTKQELMAKGEIDSLPEKFIEIIDVTLDPEERLVYEKVMVFSRTIFAQFLAQRAEKQHMIDLGMGRHYKPSWKTNYRNTQFTKAQNKLLAMHADVEAYQILVLLLRLRQICCHPALIHSMLDREDIETNAVEGTMMDRGLLLQMNKMKLEIPEQDDEPDEDDVGVNERITEHLLTSSNPVFNDDRQSSKMRAVLAKIEEIIATEDKVIVVSQWVGVLNVVASHLPSITGASYRMFTGQVAVKDRQGIMDAFNDPHTEPNILLLSLTAGGVGLNLVGANHLLLIDIHWNPQLESQAQDRIYRFGQTKNVYIYKYLCTDTIEERIKALQDRKLALAQAVLAGGGSIVPSKLTLDDLKSLFQM